MITKVCFKCGKEKLIDEFYEHPQMRDGHLNKCKECTRKDVHRVYEKNSQSKEYVEQERKRNRDKYRRLYQSLGRKSNHPENGNTKRLLVKRGVDCTGKEAHHWNYNMRNDVFLLDIKAHKLLHKYLVFDKLTKKFSFKGELINTVEEHQKVIEEILSPAGYSFEHYSF